MPEPTAPPERVQSRTVYLAGDAVVIERVTGIKATRIFAIVRALGSKSRDLAKVWAKARDEYQREHYTELDRASAMLRYGPEPLVAGGNAVLYPEGHERAGDVVMVPGPLDSMTAEDWQAQGGTLRIPRKPTTAELVAEVLDDSLEVAEHHIYRLLALVTIPNAELKAAWRAEGIDGLLEERVTLILEADLDELIELAVTAGELIDDQLSRKLESVGDRVGKALRLVGLDPSTLTRRTPATTSTPTTPPDTPSSSRPTSSTDGDGSTDGTPTPPSTPPMSSSERLAAASSSSEPD